MINTPGSTGGFIPGNITSPRPQRDAAKTADKKIDRSKFMPPRHRGFNAIPEDEVLEGLVRRALDALSQGIFWDRGSILNLVV